MSVKIPGLMTLDNNRLTLMFSHKRRKCVFLSGTGGMNHGTKARLPDGSGANSR